MYSYMSQFQGFTKKWFKGTNYLNISSCYAGGISTECFAQKKMFNTSRFKIKLNKQKYLYLMMY